MRNELKALSKETLVYGATTVVGRFLNFILVPFYVNVLKSSADYGIVTSLYTAIGFLTVIYPLGLEGAFFRYGARAEGEAPQKEKEQAVFSTGFWVVLVCASLLSLLIYSFSASLVRPLFFDPKTDITRLIPTLTFIVKLAAGILFFDSLSVLPFAVLRLEHQAMRFAVIRLVGIVVTLLLNFYFVVMCQQGIKGVFVSNLLASILVFVLLLPTITARFVFRFDKAAFQKLVPFGLTNVPAYLSSMIVQVIDRPIIQVYLGMSMLGIYQANYRMGFIMMIFVSLFDYAWRPFFMRQALKDDVQARLLFARVFTTFMEFSLIAFLGLSWGLPYLVSYPINGYSLLKSSYWVGFPIIPVVLLAYVFQGMYVNFMAGIYIKEKNKSLPMVTGVGAVINVGVNLWLIPKMGMMGAALATLFAYMAMAGLLYVIAQKAYFIPYDWKRVGLVSLLVALAMAVEMGLARSGFGLPALPVKAVLFLAATGFTLLRYMR